MIGMLAGFISAIVNSCYYAVAIVLSFPQTNKDIYVAYKHANNNNYESYIIKQGSSGVSPITGLDYWTGILDWTTGLNFFPFLDNFVFILVLT